MHQRCPLFRDSILACWKTRWLQPKKPVRIINFFSLNFTSIEIEHERMSSSQNKRSLEGEEGWGKQGVREFRTWESWASILFECPPMGGVKSKWGSNIYYYITTLSLFQFFRKNQHPEKWSLSFKNFFRKFECISFTCRYPRIYNFSFRKQFLETL